SSGRCSSRTRKRTRTMRSSPLAGAVGGAAPGTRVVFTAVTRRPSACLASGTGLVARSRPPLRLPRLSRALTRQGRHFGGVGLIDDAGTALYGVETADRVG